MIDFLVITGMVLLFTMGVMIASMNVNGNLAFKVAMKLLTIFSIGIPIIYFINLFNLI